MNNLGKGASRHAHRSFLGTPRWWARLRFAHPCYRGRPTTKRLLPLEVRGALVEEGVHALAEILAHIGAQDQILAFLARQGPADAAHRFLGDFERDRRM